MRQARLIVTGFSSFPGARQNPTEALVAALDAARLSRRFGIEIRAEVLPTEYGAVGKLLPRLWEDFEPDAAIHLGLHGRAATVRVETRAKNHMSPVRPDAVGFRPEAPAIAGQGPAVRQATLPTQQIFAALRHRCVPVRLSHDAGSYLCNYASYLSLGLAPKGALAGFLHLPWPAESPAPGAPSGRPRWLALGLAVEEAIRVVAITARSALRERT